MFTPRPHTGLSLATRVKRQDRIRAVIGEIERELGDKLYLTSVEEVRRQATEQVLAEERAQASTSNSGGHR